MDYQKLADLVMPNVNSDLSVWENQYPLRTLPEGAKVTRFAPSPTGLPHLGNVFTCNVDLRLAHQSGGVCFLRIEDTDAKRTVKDGVAKIVKMLGEFGIFFDEGPSLNGEEKGDYGPYTQSKRKALYQSCAKWLIEQGLAYPCFCSAEELNVIREKQKAANVPAPGYFGEWAECRNLTLEEVEKNLAEGKDYVIRLRSSGDAKKVDRITDNIRGTMEFPQNIMDVVLLKSDGIPTYHFAHAVDDHFMRVTDVVRGDEWIASAPIHVEMFRALGYKQPRYTHVAPLSIIDDGNKRKLSKRKDPEFGLIFYHEMGYDKDAVLEYLNTIANSGFEDWRRANPKSPIDDYKFSAKNMSVSGAVFDRNKLDDVCKNYISLLSAEKVLSRYLAWAKLFNPEMAEIAGSDPKHWREIFNIDREVPKPRKDIANWSMVRSYFGYFINEDFYADIKDGYDLGTLSADDFKAALAAYALLFDDTDDRDIWFSKVKQVADKIGYASDTKLYKANPDAYKGPLSDVAAMIRIAITNRSQTPDLYTIMQVLGADECKKRINKA
ncbi:MAG TPA: glutamate--tRNA ligase [Oscillospiraceae bacterium]|nr:glutamate--tRNA ligase [Oscillospiraceae bacterium]HPK36246.1 glutamate--tRNA ligase [Oscillospiraceae bacterium]HPR75486.1 glutamate--tRNA ligase [Oscillospiraceae bacterium]